MYFRMLAPEAVKLKLTLRLQSHTSNSKAWDRFPWSMGGKTLLSRASLNELFGNIARTPRECFPHLFLLVYFSFGSNFNKTSVG